MRILITGGAGFLGSHLCDKLLAAGQEVVCLDNLFTGSKDNIAHLLNHPKFEFVRHDVIDPFKYEVDQIYNLACPAPPPHYQYNPIKTTKTSVMGAINCLGLAKRVKARVFQALISSSAAAKISAEKCKDFAQTRYIRLFEKLKSVANGDDLSAETGTPTAASTP